MGGYHLLVANSLEARSRYRKEVPRTDRSTDSACVSWSSTLKDAETEDERNVDDELVPPTERSADTKEPFPFQCRFCSEGFYHEYKLHLHLLRSHGEFSCVFCGQIFTRLEDEWTHQNEKHLEELFVSKQRRRSSGYEGHLLFFLIEDLKMSWSDVKIRFFEETGKDLTIEALQERKKCLNEMLSRKQRDPENSTKEAEEKNFSVDSETSQRASFGFDIESTTPTVSTEIQNADFSDELTTDLVFVKSVMRTESIQLDEEADSSAASSPESDSEESSMSEDETISSQTSSDPSLVSPVLGAFKSEIVEVLMRDFGTLFDHNPRVRTSPTGNGSSNDLHPMQSSSGQPSKQSFGKRKRNDDEEGESLRDNGDDKRRKNARTECSSQDDPSLLFACPYYRRSPQKYKNRKYRSCAGPGWKSVHRVKEHVFRQHSLPIHCHRCGTTFGNESDLTAHQRLSQGCEVAIFELQGCTKDQEKLLRRRKRGLGSEENKWTDMYKTLFPDDNESMMPTPYYDDEQIPAWETHRDDELAQYEEYLGQELPRVVRRRLEQIVSESARPIESELRANLVDIVRDAQSSLFRSYRQRNMSRSASVPNGNEEVRGDRAALPHLCRFNTQEPPDNVDFLAFLPTPLVGEPSRSDQVQIEFPASLHGDTSGNHQLFSDSGYYSQQVASDVGGGFEGDFSGMNGDFSLFCNSEEAPPLASQGFS